MAGMFKIGPWFVSDALIRPEDLTVEYKLILGSTYATIKNNTGQQLALTAEDTVGFAHNGLIYEVEKISSASLDAHYIRTPAIETGMAIRNNNYSESTNVADVTQSLLGFTVTNPNETEVSIVVEPTTGSIRFITPTAAVLSVADGSYQIDGVPTPGTEITIGGLTITGDPLATEAALVLVRASSGLTLPTEPNDAGYNKFVIDTSMSSDDNLLLTATEEEVLYETTLIFDNFGQGYTKMANEDIYVSNIGSHIGSGSNAEYRDTDDHTYVLIDGNTVKEFNLTQISSSVNTDESYIYDLIESTEKVYIGYQRPYSTYVLIDYYFSKQSVADGECAEISDTATATRAIRLKVYEDKIISQYAHADIVHIAPKALSAAEIANAYQKLHYGAGAFSAPYKLYYYRDYGDHIKVIFNRETSSKYWTLEITDQTTRWKTSLVATNGTAKSTLATKYLQRYQYNGIWGIYPISDPYVLINMKTKRAYDDVADTLETSFRNDAIDIDPKTIKLFTNIMYLNISNVISSFPQLRLTYSTLAVMELAGKYTEIVYQASSGAIYGRYRNGTSYVYVEKDDLLALMNSIDANYQFSLTCNISKLIYFDDVGNEQNIAFSDSTLIASEKISPGLMRVYYKNNNTNGFVIASSYEVQE